MIDLARFTHQHGDYAFAPRNGVTDRILLEIAEQYETEVSHRFVAIRPSDLTSRYAPDARVLETIKYDGEGVFVYFEAGKKPEIFCFNAPSGRSRIGLPCLREFAAQLKAKGIKKALFRAELYIRETVDGRRAASADVTRASFSSDPAEVERLRLAVLDVIMRDGRDLRGHQQDFGVIWSLLGELAGTDTKKRFHRPEGGEANGGDLVRLFNERTQGGLEGLVIRRLDRPEVCKLKPRRTIDAAVIGYVEGDFEGNHGMMSLLTGLAYQGADRKTPLKLQAIARVGSGFNDQDRVEWLSRLGPQKLAAPLAMSDSDGRPVQFVKPGIVVELEAEDVLPADEESSGQQVFGWNRTDWKFEGLAAAPRLLLPTFHRLRPDKELNSQSVRIAQLTGRALDAPELIHQNMPALEIMRREVYTKEIKGAVAVRKLVVGRRPTAAGAFPYVLFWVDYSAGRKTPLETSTLFAHTEKRAEALAAKLLAENVTKGFERVKG